MPHRQLFWLHVKKSAGISTRALLQPHYREVDRANKPATFIQSDRVEYNDILNNFRVVLGEYQFRRCLFAKRFLYREQWESLYSFVFAREPVDRCISMFFYLYWPDRGFAGNLARIVGRSLATGTFMYNTRYAFDRLLDHAAQARGSDSIYRPLGLHFTTHTAPMWDDVPDLDGKVLLTAVFRLENLVDGINSVFEACGIDTR
ncbi:MAG: sulfotransferase family 2 domain-containing protein, partial [Gammaproteobacteria bacterium]|nr:sulfotransferase family 2 domain-containing protein [Gammaproteobacteria bacterium]